jgi:hypothetical protein
MLRVPKYWGDQNNWPNYPELLRCIGAVGTNFFDISKELIRSTLKGQIDIRGVYVGFINSYRESPGRSFQWRRGK